MLPNVVAITRKRDDSWTEFLGRISEDSLVAIFPEGRMKRLDGLDKHGKPISIKGGVADILLSLKSGKMLIAYSGGLHHVQAPGQRLPYLFKTICVGFEQLDIQDYKNSLKVTEPDAFRQAVIKDLESRLNENCRNF